MSIGTTTAGGFAVPFGIDKPHRESENEVRCYGVLLADGWRGAGVKLPQSLPAARLANGLVGEIGSGAGALRQPGGAFAPFSHSAIRPYMLPPLRGSACFPPDHAAGPLSGLPRH
jgi:hypothetical protein